MAHLRALADFVHTRLREERGFSIIEVLVSALLVSLVAVGGFAALDSAGATADRNKSRNAAAALAQADQERLRSLKATELSALTKAAATETKTVDGESYYVRSSAEWVTSGGTTPSCSTSNTRAQYLAIESKVTWPNMRAAQPVTARSLKAVPNGSLPNQGSLAIQVTSPNGAGVAGLPISVAGPENTSATTNANGCVLLSHIPVGTYTISFSRAGWVVGKLPNASTVTDQVVVAGAATSSKSYEYGQAGTANVRFRTRAVGASADIDTTGDRFTLGQAGLGIPFIKTFSQATAANTMTAGGVFPFTSAYTVWAGGCADAKPTANAQPSDPTTTIPAGSTAARVDIWEPSIRVNVSNASTDPNGYEIVAAPDVAGCAPSTTKTGTGASGSVNFDLPYGDYRLCAETTYRYEGSNYPVRKYTSVANDVRNGRTVSIDLNPFSSGIELGSC